MIVSITCCRVMCGDGNEAKQSTVIPMVNATSPTGTENLPSEIRSDSAEEAVVDRTCS